MSSQNGGVLQESEKLSKGSRSPDLGLEINVAFSQICTLAAIDMVVTDVCPGQEWMNYFAEKGIKCLYGRENDGREDHNDSLYQQ